MRYTFLRIVMINLWNRFPRIIIFPLLEVLEWCLALCSVYWFYVYSVCVYKIECLSSMDYISEAAFAPGNSCLVILGVKLDDQAMKWVCLVGKEFNLFFSEKTLFNLGDWSVSATHSLWQYLLFLSSLEMKVRHIELVQCALPLRVMSCCPSCDLCYLCPFCHLCHLCPSYVISWWKKNVFLLRPGDDHCHVRLSHPFHNLLCSIMHCVILNIYVILSHPCLMEPIQKFSSIWNNRVWL